MRREERPTIQQCSELPEKEIQVRPALLSAIAKDVYNSAGRLQKVLELRRRTTCARLAPSSVFLTLSHRRDVQMFKRRIDLFREFC